MLGSDEELQVLILRFLADDGRRLSSTSSKRKSVFSMSSLPASIFEKSRMSLMMPSSACAADLHLGQIVALPGVSSVFKRQMRHADDGVHRRADFMAHVGQEIALGLGRRFRRFLGNCQVDSSALGSARSFWVSSLLVRILVLRATVGSNRSSNACCAPTPGPQAPIR